MTDFLELNEELRPFSGLPGIQGKLYNLPRNENEKNINDYCPAILEAWGPGNIDIQFVSAEHGYIVDYVTGYASKMDKKCSDS